MKAVAFTVNPMYERSWEMRLYRHFPVLVVLAISPARLHAQAGQTDRMAKQMEKECARWGRMFSNAPGFGGMVMKPNAQGSMTFEVMGKEPVDSTAPDSTAANLARNSAKNSSQYACTVDKNGRVQVEAPTPKEAPRVQTDSATPAARPADSMATKPSGTGKP